MEAELGGTGGTNDSAPRPLGFAERTETYRIATMARAWKIAKSGVGLPEQGGQRVRQKVASAFDEMIAGPGEMPPALCA
jgi:hypothetical protein